MTHRFKAVWGGGAARCPTCQEIGVHGDVDACLRSLRAAVSNGKLRARRDVCDEVSRRRRLQAAIWQRDPLKRVTRPTSGDQP